ncbi:hypothetical protein ACJ72_02140 [Emergomyces africanus]|uniref:Uncharacterized protein n=1 Tax=Emergomyces africanus TaxID=1955775 RepID=A0A1B7P3C2_9EURO|nr:hypothetical protein ACJ72_02140 [Emergomyces africanus]
MWPRCVFLPTLPTNASQDLCPSFVYHPASPHSLE